MAKVTDRRLLFQARRLRDRMTPWEVRLWQRLRGRRLNGHRFRRQHPVPPYVLDFACVESMLAVELDGSQHAEGDPDRAPDGELMSLGWHILRFWNAAIDRDTDAVCDAILAHLESADHHPIVVRLGP